MSQKEDITRFSHIHGNKLLNQTNQHNLKKKPTLETI